MYLWIKALHVIAVISWMAGLLYLPRLFVYHSTVGPGAQSELFKLMEGKLIRIIMIPAMAVTWASGLYIAISGGHFHDGWFHVKLALVLGLTATHVFFGKLARDFQADRNSRPQRYFRIINEVPTLLMIAIVILVIVKPF